MCDGGVNPESAKACAAAGANAVVAGTAVFCSADGPAAAIASIRAPLKARFGA
jgi:ribulose-phosphate 3-epimerase